MARQKVTLWTAYASVSGAISFQEGVGFPAGMLPVCCGERDALKANFADCRNGDGFAIPGISERTAEMHRYEALERLRVRMVGREGLMSYYSGMNRRDLG
ncbi:MAG: hypothetical protein ABF968_07240 [Acetobacter sp.]|uniref:hypothetical protein n=1 Tax=Acetobacter sp. TaxID=440 RepID=UPI0039E985E0